MTTGHVTTGHVTSGHVTSGHVTSGHVTTTSSLPEGNSSIGCQTALSYPRQDTLVPLTALLQLVNNSILTVMENIGEFTSFCLKSLYALKHITNVTERAGVF